jgi:transposase, IS30 family
MGIYTQYTRDDRAVIAASLRCGTSYRTIANALGCHHTSVIREVTRNRDPDGVYRAPSAHRRAQARRAVSKHHMRLLEGNVHLAETVEALLDPLIAPEVIGYCLGIHHATIYAWIRRSRPDLAVRLPQHGRKRRRYGTKRAQKQGWTRLVRPLAERIPQQLNWEGDTVRGSGRTRLLTHVETASLFTRVDVIPDGTCGAVHTVLDRMPLSGTITYDRGTEFASWTLIEESTGATVYFADPHHPWQRGKNENTNGRLRRVYPKRTDFATVSPEEIARTVALMNDTPRKSLCWRTPREVYVERCGSG